MAGHSKWANIKHKKATVDKKKAKLFSKLLKEITVSVKESGSDTAMNTRLKLILAKAKEANISSKNIDNAVKRGLGEIKGGDIIETIYEGYGPNGVAIMVECLTDNSNRTFSDVRTVFSKNGGNLGESGSVAWQFDKKGVIVVEKKNIDKEEKFVEQLMDIEVEDYSVENDLFILYTSIPYFDRIVVQLKERKIEILDSEINYVPKNYVELLEKDVIKVNELIEKIDEIDDVQLIASNEKIKL